jgi:hypothetical protein
MFEKGSTMSNQNVVASVIGFAAAAHTAWRTDFESSKGSGAERWKSTVDGDWLKANVGQPFCKAAERQVNINVPFEQLPADWQIENINAVNLACTLVMGQILAGGELDEQFIEDTAAVIHDQWTLRQRATGKDSTDSWFAGLSVPYSELPEVEKEKDRVFVRGAISVCEALRS